MLIRLDQVNKTYQTGSTIFTALNNVNFHLEQSEMIAIVGASGSGKSTLMNIIGFLDQCTTGDYYFSGKKVSHLNGDELAILRNQKIGFVFQSFFLLPRLDVLHNVMLPLFYRNDSAATAKEKAMAILAKVGMAKMANRKPSQLSGGQQQRVAIARALVGEPELILADEPTGALDSKTGDEIMALLLELHVAEKRTIIIVTHDHGVSQQCQRQIVLKDGMIVSS